MRSANGLPHRRPAASWWRRLRFRDVVILTAVPVLAGLYLVVGSVLAYQRNLQFVDWWSRGVRLEGLFRDRVRALVSLPSALSLIHGIDQSAPDAGLVRLHVDPAVWDRVQGDPLIGWGQWINGTIETGGSLLPVRLRKRGDNSIHWLTEKRTFTVRTPRTEFYKRFRTFALSVREVLPTYVANRLAQEFDLLAPTTAVVPVFINNRFAGMYRFIEVVDESFLRPFDEMPGNIYRGDAVSRGDYYKGLPRNLFANPYIWDRVAVNDRPTGPGAEGLRLFLDDVNGTTFADHLRLMSRLDREEIARLFAYLLILGDPYHMDALHNQLWYEDPSSALLHPIPWDLRVLDLGSPPQELNPFQRAVLRDPFLLDQIQRDLREALRGDRIYRVADSLSTAAYLRYQKPFDYDRLRRGLVPDVGSVDGIQSLLRGNLRILQQWLDDSRVAFHAGITEGQPIILDFETRGFAGSDLDGLEVVTNRLDRPRLFRDGNLNGILDAADAVLSGEWTRTPSGLHFTPATPEPLLAGWRTDLVGLQPGTLHYRYFLARARGVSAVHPLLRNRITGAQSEVLEWSAGQQVSPTSTWSPWRYPVVRGRVVRLRGRMHLTENLRIPAGDTLLIEAGTDLRLGPEVSIVSRGLVLAKGTKSQPILVRPTVDRQPWGTFSLQGDGASGSVVEYTHFVGGGGALVDRIEYTGMVNVHRARNVQFSHDLFQENVRSDDTFHGLYADLVLRDSRFVRANSDAVDFDISGGEIVNNSFEDSGGDAIDLMTSTPFIAGNVILRSGDKGISVGEASRPIIFNNTVSGCRRGIEVKDRSTPLILNTVVTGNGAGIYLDRKNWRYGGGGWATVINSVIHGNGVDLQNDSYSRLSVAGSIGFDSIVGIGAEELASSTLSEPATWVYSSLGLSPVSTTGSTAGLLEQWAPAPITAPIVQARFEDDFGEIADGWKASGGVGRLEKGNETLRATVENRPGEIVKAIDWDLTQATRATLVVEVASRDLEGASISLVSARGAVSWPLPLSRDLALFRFLAVELPPDRYTTIKITVVPSPRIEKLQRRTGWTDLKPGVLLLSGYRLYQGPAPEVIGLSH